MRLPLCLSDYITDDTPADLQGHGVWVIDEHFSFAYVCRDIKLAVGREGSAPIRAFDKRDCLNA